MERHPRRACGRLSVAWQMDVIEIHSNNVTLNRAVTAQKVWNGPGTAHPAGADTEWGTACVHDLLVFCDAVAHQSAEVTRSFEDDGGKRPVRELQPCMLGTTTANHHPRLKGSLSLCNTPPFQVLSSLAHSASRPVALGPCDCISCNAVPSNRQMRCAMIHVE